MITRLAPGREPPSSFLRPLMPPFAKFEEYTNRTREPPYRLIIQPSINIQVSAQQFEILGIVI